MFSGLADVDYMVNHNQKVLVPHLERELFDACEVYREVKEGFSYTSSRKNRQSTASTAMRDVGAALSLSV